MSRSLLSGNHGYIRNLRQSLATCQFEETTFFFLFLHVHSPSSMLRFKKKLKLYMDSRSCSYMNLGSVAIWFSSSAPLTLIQNFFTGRLEMTRNETNESEVKSNMQVEIELYQLLFLILYSSNIVYGMLNLHFQWSPIASVM